MRRGKLIIVVGPTGSGKGTLIRHAMSRYATLAPSISCTTRGPRPGEVDGSQYHFLSRNEFERRISTGAFLEWAEYGGNYYGTPREGIEAKLAEGISVILEIEVQGARIIRAHTKPEDRLIIFIDAGSWEALESRIRARAPMTDKEIEKRRRHYEDELTFKSEANVVIHNPDGALTGAEREFDEAIASAIEA